MPNTESVTDFFQVLNNVHPSLSFTMELNMMALFRSLVQFWQDVMAL